MDQEWGQRLVEGGRGTGVPDKALPAIAIRLDRTPILFSAQTQSLGKIRYLQLALLSDAPCLILGCCSLRNIFTQGCFGRIIE